MTTVPLTDDAPRPVVAAFDVDGTLTAADCVVPFLRRVAGTPRIATGLARRPHRAVAAVVRRDRDALKALVSRAAFAGRSHDAVEAAGATFAAAVARDGLRADTASRLEWHRDEGHATVLVSASFGAYLRPLATTLRIDGVVCTELEVGPDDRCTGALLGGNCRGAEKVARLHAWLDAHHGGRGAVELWVYGDSPGDRELLADADHAVWARDVVLGAVPEVVT